MNGSVVIIAILLSLLLSIIIGAYLFSVWWSKHLHGRSVRRREGARELVTLTHSNARANGRRWVEVRVREPGNPRRTNPPGPALTKSQHTATQNQNPPRHDRERNMDHRAETHRNDHQWDSHANNHGRVETQNNDNEWGPPANDNHDNDARHSRGNAPDPDPAPAHPSPRASTPKSWHPDQGPALAQSLHDMFGGRASGHKNSRAASRVGSNKPDHGADGGEWEGYSNNNPADEARPPGEVSW
ncbi:uncharacterized protein BO66DRAFT_389865 [Aspergillus aculeatinus CBS 121060]|uniref:Uncharacterized protein n=1 Tax=Aspergillus aculeatinus CBS 121060 TaxID=1448322 RepID=A0ACD1HGK4_9EURO|nr:hypothetical protein BO66DRAFT_389865 [Aspergillus aculeatinus CBS 121060]RAH72570.1 hypothetical protein BO66DRAFT_389865 [Aspergillus aculeatinus CBS 121060]